MTANGYLTKERFDDFLRMEDEHHQRAEKEAKRQADDIASIKKTLFGNGVMGWDEILRNLQKYVEQEIAEKKTRKEQAEELQKFWTRLAITLVATNLITLLMSLLLKGH